MSAPGAELLELVEVAVATSDIGLLCLLSAALGSGLCARGADEPHPAGEVAKFGEGPVAGDAPAVDAEVADVGEAINVLLIDGRVRWSREGKRRLGQDAAIAYG